MFIDDNESITGKVDVYAYAFKTYEMLTFKLVAVRDFEVTDNSQ